MLHISDAFPPTVFYLLPTSGRSFNNGLNERMARKHARIRSRFAITLRITKVSLSEIGIRSLATRKFANDIAHLHVLMTEKKKGLTRPNVSCNNATPSFPFYTRLRARISLDHYASTIIVRNHVRVRILYYDYWLYSLHRCPRTAEYTSRNNIAPDAVR